MTLNNRKGAIVFLIPTVVTFVVYLRTLCPTVYTGDSGELALAIYTMGIAHPTGYPLLTLLGKFFITILPGNTAYLLNMLSALLAAAAAGVGALFIRKVLFVPEQRNDLDAILISSATAIFWGFSNALWGAATGLEVYSLGIFLIISSLLMILKYVETSKDKYLLLSVYLFSLGLANHLTAIVLVFPLGLAMIRHRVPIGIWLWAFGLLIVAISSYLYIPIRSSRYPIVDWDHPANLSALIDHITARRYRGFVSGIRPDNFLENLWRSFIIAGSQLPLWLGIVGLVGVLFGKIKSHFKFIAILMIAFNFLAAALYDIPDIDQYYLPSFFFFAVGLAALLMRLFAMTVWKWKATASILVIVILLALGFNWKRNDQSHNRLAYIYGMNILKCVPQNSLLISIGDNSNSSLFYLHFVEGERPDLEVYDPVKTYGRIRDRLGIRGDAGNINGLDLCKRMIAANPQRAYVSKEHVLIRGNAFDYSAYKLTPNGMVYRIGNWPLDTALWSRLEIPYFEDPQVQVDPKGLSMLCDLHLARGEDLWAQGDSARAMKDFETANKLALGNTEAALHNSLGVFFRHRRLTAMAESEFERALKSRHLTAFERANVLVNLGNLTKDKGDFDRAIEFYDQALKINSGNREAKYNRALTLAYNGISKREYLEAAHSFEDALEIDGSDSKLIYNLGVIYDRSVGDTNRAIYNYEMFVKRAPNAPEAEIALQRIKELSR